MLAPPRAARTARAGGRSQGGRAGAAAPGGHRRRVNTVPTPTAPHDEDVTASEAGTVRVASPEGRGAPLPPCRAPLGPPGRVEAWVGL